MTFGTWNPFSQIFNVLSREQSGQTTNMHSLLTLTTKSYVCRLLNDEWSIQVLGTLAVCKAEVSRNLGSKPSRQSPLWELGNLIKNHPLAQNVLSQFSLHLQLIRFQTKVYLLVLMRFPYKWKPVVRHKSFPKDSFMNVFYLRPR